MDRPQIDDLNKLLTTDISRCQIVRNTVGRLVALGVTDQRYRPQFSLRTTDVTGAITLPEGVKMAMPGDYLDLEVELIQPLAIEAGLRFAGREGGNTVSVGVITVIVA